MKQVPRNVGMGSRDTLVRPPPPSAPPSPSLCARKSRTGRVQQYGYTHNAYLVHNSQRFHIERLPRKKTCWLMVYMKVIDPVQSLLITMEMECEFLLLTALRNKKKKLMYLQNTTLNPLRTWRGKKSTTTRKTVQCDEFSKGATVREKGDDTNWLVSRDDNENESYIIGHVWRTQHVDPARRTSCWALTMLVVDG